MPDQHTEVHPELISQLFAYASVLRASHDAQIFTNDAANLAESLSRDVSKASAIGLGTSQNPVASAGLEQVATAVMRAQQFGNIQAEALEMLVCFEIYETLKKALAGKSEPEPLLTIMERMESCIRQMKLRNLCTGS